jgi:hypothetical protein
MLRRSLALGADTRRTLKCSEHVIRADETEVAENIVESKSGSRRKVEHSRLREWVEIEEMDVEGKKCRRMDVCLVKEVNVVT